MKRFAAALALGLATFAIANQPLTWIRSAVVSPDGQYLATAGDENIIRLYSFRDTRLLRQVTLPKGANSFVTQLAFMPSGKQLVSAGSDGRIRIWNPATLKQVREIRAGTEYVSGIAVAKGSPYVASSGYDNRAKLWNVATGKLVRAFSGLRSDAYAVALSPDGKRIAAGGPDKTLRIWDTANGKLVRTLRPGQVMSIAWSPDGKWIATDGADMKYYLFDAKTGKLTLSQPTDAGKMITGLAFAPDSQSFIAGHYGGGVERYSLSGELLQVYTGAEQNMGSVEFSPNGKAIVGASFDSTVRIWNTETGELTTTLGTPKKG
ncbi:MAG TPA: WD40 repeat domain-containing protein [Fimbriimonadaceae bacterium]|nr:WD40 repeat domain-containing protein [Fimbriimonadaceae bacterium]